MIANNVLSRTATENYNGESDNHSFFDNVYVDIDSDNSTFNSSSANFVNPHPDLVCLNIKKAFLYWAAADKENEGGEDNQPDWNFNDIKLMLPGETSYETLSADEVLYRGRDFHFSNDPYVCFKDITNLVANLESPYGTYQVANVEAKTGFLFQHGSGNTGTSGGWQIVYVYESPGLVSKNVSIFDGYAHITRDFNNYDINFSGFRTVPTGSVNVNTLIGSLEGDRSLIGDRFQIQNIADEFVDITAPLRNSFNFFNSRITLENANFTDRNPASLNTLGFDAAVFRLDNTDNNIIGNNQSSATIRLASAQETYSLFLIGLAIEVWSPSLYPLEISSNAFENITNAGDLITFEFNFSNTGNDNALNVILSETIPTNVEFVSADNLPDGVSYNYDTNTRLLEFFIEDGLLDIGSPTLNIQFELRVNTACYFLEDTCNLELELLFTATYNGEENPNMFTTFSSDELDDCQLGNPLLININQPIAVWETPIGSLDRTLVIGNPNNLRDAQALFPIPDKCNFNIIKTSGDFVQNSDCDYEGTYTNTWNFTDACGRTIADFVQVITVPSNQVFDGSQITISKVVTPNQDEWNEYFTINEIKGCDFIVDLKIFNRWGAQIYHSDNYQNNWNGRSSSSSIGSSDKVPTGTYYYIINIIDSGLKPLISTFYIGTK
ncbi:gliding motility-associated C-terminal domain-containing protein [uncultured Algibacter sp.]|uniref:T9SS type B sorting domain-containing protein n=1 Tax=uncultured Algibacter sp. TaxID=298659 RepID=UPI00261357B6|nr:gliding motility-associated C-terminal domain-containing protein [uncultured Algibacter sp.]